MNSNYQNWLITGMMAVSLTAAGPSMGQTAHSDAEPVGIEIQPTHRAANAGEDYWTPERMRNATPLNIVIENQSFQHNSLEPEEPLGPPEGMPGTKPLLQKSSLGGKQLYRPQDQESASQDFSETNDSATPESILLQFQDRPHPFTGHEVLDSYEQYPLQTIGKLFFTQGEFDYVCSASALVSDNQRLVWTAGHCVSGGDGFTWSTNVRFVPAYRYGAAPFGSWEVCGLYTTWNWYYYGDISYDMGALKVCDRSDGARLHEVVGSLGFLANVPRVQHWNAFGYPAAEPFNGESLHTCQAGHGRDDTVMQPMTIGIGCDMTGGSSGGPWILEMQRQGAGNYLNGVNSYGYSNLPNVMFSPYFGDEFLNLRDYAISNGA
jgi:V8-like Glu-specific endopeptidase